jgi:nucleoside-diphosphate-sugar epimerase
MAEIRPTHVLHLAWYVTHGRFWSALDNVDWVAASLDLIRLFGESGGQRWVGAGTCAEYDWSIAGVCGENQTPLRPNTLYGLSKHTLRELQEGIAVHLGISMAWGRIFHLYGPGEAPQRLVPTVIRSLLAGDSVALTHGQQIRDYSHAQDVAKAFVSILTSDCVGPVNIGSGDSTTVRRVCETIADSVGRRELLNFDVVSPDPKEPLKLLPALDRLHATGFAPDWSLRDGIASVVEWWRSRARVDYAGTAVSPE